MRNQPESGNILFPMRHKYTTACPIQDFLVRFSIQQGILFQNRPKISRWNQLFADRSLNHKFHQCLMKILLHNRTYILFENHFSFRVTHEKWLVIFHTHGLFCGNVSMHPHRDSFPQSVKLSNLVLKTFFLLQKAFQLTMYGSFPKPFNNLLQWHTGFFQETDFPQQRNLSPAVIPIAVTVHRFWLKESYLIIINKGLSAYSMQFRHFTD